MIEIKIKKDGSGTHIVMLFLAPPHTPPTQMHRGSII